MAPRCLAPSSASAGAGRGVARSEPAAAGAWQAHRSARSESAARWSAADAAGTARESASRRRAHGHVAEGHLLGIDHVPDLAAKLYLVLGYRDDIICAFGLPANLNFYRTAGLYDVDFAATRFQDRKHAVAGHNPRNAHLRLLADLIRLRVRGFDLG